MNWMKIEILSWPFSYNKTKLNQTKPNLIQIYLKFHNRSRETQILLISHRLLHVNLDVNVVVIEANKVEMN